jgi:hypothetical protein
MAKILRTDTNELIGFLDDSRCRGPLPKETRHITFQGWRLNDSAPWLHGPTDASGASLPQMALFTIEVADTESEITLFVRSQDVDFIKAHPSFRALPDVGPMASD